jgi:hypothetical protein
MYDVPPGEQQALERARRDAVYRQCGGQGNVGRGDVSAAGLREARERSMHVEGLGESRKALHPTQHNQLMRKDFFTGGALQGGLRKAKDRGGIDIEVVRKSKYLTHPPNNGARFQS